MKNKIEDLRNHLFATLEGLRDEESPMDIERANAVAGVAQVIIDSAKAETQFLQVTGATSGSGFMPEPERVPAVPQLTAVAGGRGRA